jgi:hypothetical protein
MIFFADIKSVLAAITSFSMGSAADLQPAAKPLWVSVTAVGPRDQICNAAEMLYANQDNIADATARAAAQTLCGQCAAFAGAYGWMQDRAGQITSAMRRNLGETALAGTSWPDPSTDPPPLAVWVPAP